MDTTNQDTYATIDLGSNSFHMMVARHSNDQLVIIDKMKEMVRLAGGLNEQQLLTDEAIENGISCLEKFGQRLKEIPGSNVRVVGTNTLRQARNGGLFLTKARAALGHSIDIIAGREEARLIYVGVANTIFNDKHKRLVIDIGGGSTEFIVGKGFDPLLTESLYMGCVNTTRRFFDDGEINNKRMRKAILFARQELESVESIYKREGWKIAYGTSGSIGAIQQVLTENGWSDSAITLPALKKLKEKLIDIGHVDKIELPGLTNKRIPVFAGGVAILIGCFEALEIDDMSVCHGALREGLLYDLLGRRQEKDIRNESVKAMAAQYTVDTDHTERVKNTANILFKQVKKDWSLNKPDNKLINWSCELHTIGLRVAHSQYHKHGAYLVTHSDMPGFSKQEQAQLASLIRFHRRKLNQEDLQACNQGSNERMTCLYIIMRLAVLLHRSRMQDPLPEIKLAVDDKDLQLAFPENWLAEHPLTETDLETEAGYLDNIGIKLNYS